MAAGTRRLRKRLAEGPAEPGRGPGADRPGIAGHQRRQHLDRPGPGTALGNLGAPPRRPLRRGRALDRPRAGRREAEAMVETVTSYLRGFGPATKAEIADWIGVPLDPGGSRPASRSSCAAFAAPTARSWSTCRGRRCPIPRPPPRSGSCRSGTRPCSPTPAAPRSSPTAHRGKVFSSKTPQSIPTFTVDGAVAGTWRYEKGRVRTEPFETPRRRAEARAGGRGGAPRRASTPRVATPAGSAQRDLVVRVRDVVAAGLAAKARAVGQPGGDLDAGDHRQQQTARASSASAPGPPWSWSSAGPRRTPRRAGRRPGAAIVIRIREFLR